MVGDERAYEWARFGKPPGGSLIWPIFAAADRFEINRVVLDGPTMHGHGW